MLVTDTSDAAQMTRKRQKHRCVERNDGVLFSHTRASPQKESHMLWLRTLGAVHVIGEKGNPLDGAASQRRLLALLSTLGVAGETGLTREQLLRLLWPAGEMERARHALTQSFYHARRVLRCDDLFLIGAEIRLNFARISCDVHELDVAMRASDFERAAHLYGGIFLDGFVLPGSKEFERWTTVERCRIAGQMTNVFEQLASLAHARREYEAAIAWRKKQFAIDPLNSAVAKGLMEAMAVAGDRVGALQQAHVHSAIVKDQLGVEPEPALRSLVDQLRAELECQPGDSAATLVSTESARRAGQSHVRHWFHWITRSSRSHVGQPTRVAFATTVVLLCIFAAISVVPRSRLTATVPDNRDKVVVAPFRVTGADASLGYLREGLVELLSLRLGEDSIARAVDAGTVLSAWRSNASRDDARQLSRRRALAIARRLEAARVVIGSVVGNANRVVINASLIDVVSDSSRADASVEGSSDSLTTLVNRLASKLIAASAGENDRFTDQTTPSPAALRAFLDGQSSYRRADYAAALSSYERALQLDSTFALAALHLALASDQINDAEQHDRALALAWAYRAELSTRDRVHLLAFAGPRYPAPTNEAEQLEAWERAVRRAPDRADVWYELGERLLHHGALLGLRDSRERAAAAFRRALDLDPRLVPARQLLVLAVARSRDSALSTTVTSQLSADSLGDLAPALRWRLALASGDAREITRIEKMLTALDDANLRLIGMSSLFDAVGIEDGARALETRMERGGADPVDALMAAHALALNAGRPALALRLTQSLQTLEPGSRAFLRLRVLDALYGDGDSTAAAESARELARYADAPAAPEMDSRGLQLADLCVLEQWRLWHGVTAGARQAVSMLRSSALPRIVVPLSPNQVACADILDATWSVATNQKDALHRVVRLDSLMLGGPAVSDAGTYAHIVVARLYDRLGQPCRALDAIRNRTYMVGWPRYLATARREEGRLAALAGDVDGAVGSYQRYLTLRATAESSVQATDKAVRTELASLSQQKQGQSEGR